MSISAISSAASGNKITLMLANKSSSGASNASMSAKSSTSSSSSSSEASSQIKILEKKLEEIAAKIKEINSSKEDVDSKDKKIQSYLAQEMQINSQISQLQQSESNSGSTTSMSTYA